MTKELLQTEVNFYNRNLASYRKRYPDQFLLIHGRKLHGHFATVEEAVDEGTRRFKAGPFLVRQVGQGAPSQTIHVLKHGLLHADIESPLLCS